MFHYYIYEFIFLYNRFTYTVTIALQLVKFEVLWLTMKPDGSWRVLNIINKI